MSRSRAIRRSIAVAAVAGAAAVSARALVRPRQGAERRLMDWDAVRRTAVARSGERARLDSQEAARLALACDAVAREMAPMMAEVCSTAPAAFPSFSILDRHGVIDVNVAIARRLMEPVEQLRASIPESAMTAMGRQVASRYVGELFGVLSQRVLGQYDPVLMLPGPAAAERPGTALYLVEPNVAAFQRAQRVPPEPLRRWLVLHEVTHAWQFESHAWLAPHIGALMNEMLVTGVVEQLGGGRRMATLEALRQLPATLGDQLRGIGRLRAIMSVLEGYGNFVMHRVGSEHIEGFDRLESAFHQRQSERSLLERLVLALTGMAVKLRQYELGERFAVAVTEAGGYPLLNRVWEGPEMMPSLAEMRVPQRWIERARGL
ncbi:MAG: zinc-dependent metalloprotease [Candidatus Dormibacteria bacterium]|jgi:coenzyme F420 biosynthesis associated uncharacterized protein